MVIKCAARILLARLAIWRGASVSDLMRLADSTDRGSLSADDWTRIGCVSFAITLAGEWAAPKDAPCLPVAVAGVLELRSLGYPAVLRIAVMQDESRRVDAHAFVECDGRAVIGVPVRAMTVMKRQDAERRKSQDGWNA